MCFSIWWDNQSNEPDKSLTRSTNGDFLLGQNEFNSYGQIMLYKIRVIPKADAAIGCPWKMIVYTQEQFLECSRKLCVTTELSWMLLQASCWRGDCFSFPSRNRWKSLWKPYRRKYFFKTNMTFPRYVFLYRIISRQLLQQQELETQTKT